MLFVQASIFFWLTVQELAVQCKDIDENMAPAVEPTVSEPSSKGNC